MNDNIIDLVIVSVLTVALIVAFSIGCFPEEVFPPRGKIGLKYPGDSGTVIPGKGDEMAEVFTQAEAVEAEIQESSGSTTKAESKIQTDFVINENDVKKDIETEDNRMVDIAVSFWHGVAAVLIGEAAALLVATAYLKIRLARDEK